MTVRNGFPLKQTLHTSVRELVEFILRSGDLDLTVFGSINPQEAIRIHQKIQKSRTGDYQSEVTISHNIETDRFTLEIGGRIDGVFTGLVIANILTAVVAYGAVKKFLAVIDEETRSVPATPAPDPRPASH